MFKGSVYGGCFTIFVVAAMILFLFVKLGEMSAGSNDISKQIKKSNNFDHEHYREV